MSSKVPEERRFLSLAEAAALERELLEEYCFGRQQLVELCGYASAVAVTKAFPLPSLSRKQRTVLVVCGPEQNGAVGLACARHLRVFEYQPSVFSPARPADPLHRDLTTQCEKMDIPFLSFLPAEVRLIDDAYGLVVDAVLGPGVRPAEAGGPCARALTTMKRLSIPLVSLDVPSGTGPGVSYQPVSPSSPSSVSFLFYSSLSRLLLFCPRPQFPPFASSSLSFHRMDGVPSLTEGHTHPKDGKDTGGHPGDPESPLALSSPAALLARHWPC
ncbi:yjeF N-terminal domain-containing protein 3 isoform X3 [Nannospalax galili]|uniref:yjeF N-terminal domain-containing protein 3 isoform X3 n=1 Tax=Nannospalax galili TaxID=1026970 RepID=UPI00111C0C6B|nr:yjeF N-terminal domain-containing protein 3 isoform X3 [Nannospalax galili]